MPPHCDTLDGPVVKAARMALEQQNINLVLPWIPQALEDELKKVFQAVLPVRKLGRQAAEVADYWFFETAVRLHRAGENAAYTGLKPAGLDWGPVVPKADKAIETGELAPVLAVLRSALEEEVKHRFERALSLKRYEANDVAAGREYVHALLGFVLYSHHVYATLKGAGVHAD